MAMLAEISISNPKRTELKHPLINIIMAKKAPPSAAVAMVAMRVQIHVSERWFQLFDQFVANLRWTRVSFSMLISLGSFFFQRLHLGS